MIIKNLTRNTKLANEAKVAKTFFTRFMGLMGKKSLSQGDGLLITPCKSIHMFFMKFPLDVVFIDKMNVVVYTIEDIKPWKVSKIIAKAHQVIELPVGTIQRTGTHTGDRIDFEI
ncbi:MAG: DUF192 domain-containing protein [Clostridia bacterium]|nr:DUF192 domain-containing protein [Clostridia bacterium]